MRIRPAALGVLAALVAAVPAVVPLTVSGAAAVAAVETCQGQSATVVGDGTDVVGTDGPDVIVARTSSSQRGIDVRARGGDDLICLRGVTGYFSVFGEEGDDSVTVEGEDGALLDTRTVLGPGDDRYVGGPGADLVTDWDRDGGDDAQGVALPDSGDDIISTLGGNDVVLAGGRTGGAQTDGIDLGEGDDVLQIGPSGTTAESRLRGGPGSDNLTLYSIPEQHMGLDLAERRATVVRSRVLARGWTAFESYVVGLNVDDDGYEYEQPPAAITVRGSQAADTVSLETDLDQLGFVVLDVELLGGDDDLGVPPSARGRVNGGDGRDEIGVGAGGAAGEGKTTRLDLSAGRLTISGQSGGLTVSRFQDARGNRSQFAGPVVVVGDEQANNLSGCASFHGGGGNDVIRAVGVDPLVACRGFRASGGPGRDRLIGGPGNDVLIGGTSYDTANGYGGIDTCQAERRTACER